MHEESSPLLEILYDVARWYGRPDHPVVKEVTASLLQHWPSVEAVVATVLQSAIRDHERVHAVHAAALLYGVNSPEVLAKASEPESPLAPLLEFARRRGGHKHERSRRECETLARRTSADSAEASAIPPLWRIPNAASYTLLLADASVDEATGMSPPPAAQNCRSYEAYYLAAMWPGTMSPDGAVAPDDWEAGLDELASNSVHAVGVSIRGSRRQALRSLLHWVLRLFPRPSGPTEITALVMTDSGGERHVDEQLSQQLTVEAAMVGDLASVDVDVGEAPQACSPNVMREDRWAEKVRDAAKEPSLLQPAQLLREVWAAARAADLPHGGRLARRLRCLSCLDSLVYLAALDAHAAGRPLGYELWSTLVSEPGSDSDESLAGHILRGFAPEIRSSPVLWSQLAGALSRKIEGGGVDFLRLGSEVDWLSKHQPAEETALPATLRLVWLTTQLQVGNSLGVTDAEIEQEVRYLCDTLFEEDARLVCQAELRLAVRETNRFAFERASAALSRWQEEDVAILGLRLWGRVRSSLGQHAAFLGRHEQAISLFDEALDAFDRLSDPSVRELEWTQTSTYRAMAALDNPRTSAEEARGAVSALVDLTEPHIMMLATSADRASQYRHHLLVRYLAQRGRAEERQAYVSVQPSWRSLEGHPWPLIQAYRAILLQLTGRVQAARQLMTWAWAATSRSEFGPTLRLIGAALGLVRACWGDAWPAGRETLQALRGELPGAASRLAVLDHALQAKPSESFDALQTLAEILPFNFR